MKEDRELEGNTKARFFEKQMANFEDVEDLVRGSVDLQPGESKFWAYGCVISGMLA